MNATTVCSGVATEIASDSICEMTPTVAQLAQEIERARIEAGLTTEELLASLRQQRARYYAEHYASA